MTAPFTDPLLDRQWTIDRTGHPGFTVDLNLRAVWSDYSGAGVRIGVYDSLVEAAHPDLAANYDATREVEGLNYTFTLSAHGTAVAGIIAAPANGTGVVGVAHGATITGVPVVFATSINIQDLPSAMAAAQRFDVVNMSYGGRAAFDPDITPTEWAAIAPGYASAIVAGRGGLGTILVTGAGNERQNFTSANLSQFQTERAAIVVGAVGPGGLVTTYSSEGANLFVVAPSRDNFLGDGVTTTDQAGSAGYNDGSNPDAEPVPADYTSAFGGTSAAAPMVAGIAALMLEANPALGWRDVRDILAITARHTGTPIGATPAARELGRWDVNAATELNGGGYHFSIDYGFGLVDALAAVRLAESWTGRQDSANEASRSATLSAPVAIPDGGAATELGFVVAPGVRAETVTLRLDITHRAASDLVIRVIAPSGTESVLFARDSAPPNVFGSTTAFRPWTFVSHAFRGEDAAGAWRVVVADVNGGNLSEGVVNAARLDVFGDAGTADDTWFFTNEYGALAGVSHTTRLVDRDGGEDVLNAAAVTAASVIDLRSGATGSINGVALTIERGSLLEHAVGGDGTDRIIGNVATNRLQGMRGDDVIFGLGGADTLDGGRGADLLHGGAGVDVLHGGAGDDLFVVDSPNDMVVERDGEGTDRVRAHASFVLPGAVEQLVLAGALDLAGTGSATANLLVGNRGDNLLRGLAGSDTLRGQDGADTLLGGGGGDRMTGGRGADLLDGGAGADTLVGVGGDTLIGGAGRDRLVSSVGAADTFLWTAPSEGRDVLLAFTPGHDLLAFSASGFGGGLVAGAPLEASQFRSEAGPIVVGPSSFGQFVYESDAGRLWWDADGAGTTEAVLVAWLVARPTISIGDFVIV